MWPDFKNYETRGPNFKDRGFWFFINNSMALYFFPNGSHIELFKHAEGIPEPKIWVTTNTEFPDQYQVRFKHNSCIDKTKSYIAQLFTVNSKGQVTGLKRAFIYDENSESKLLFEVQLINNVWQGLFKAYVSSETEPSLFVIFKDQIKEGEEIEF